MTPTPANHPPVDTTPGAFLAQLHRRPWIGWQHRAAALIEARAGTATRTGPGYLYPVVVVLVPRQCGKTRLVFDIAQGRCWTQPDYRAAYCAQTGHVTTERFTERMAELAGTPLGRRVRCRRSAGTERMTFGAGSFLKAFPPKDGALRSSALDLVIIDEAQEIGEDLGRALDQTILPTFTTRPRRQLILIGTAGTARSTYLARYLELARAGTPGVGLIEYGAAEPITNPADEALWQSCHPGLAGGLTDLDALRGALVMGEAGFVREYLNVWTVTSDQTIPAELWNGAAAPLARPAPAGRLVLAVDVAVERTSAAIVACWPEATTGTPTVELVDYAPGVSWAAGRLAELATRHRPAMIAADSAGPVATVIDDYARANPPVPITTVTAREYGAACAAFYDDLASAAVQHRAEPALDRAAAGAAQRPIGDAWAWGRRTSSGDVSPLVAATLARWAWHHRPPPAPKPILRYG